MRRTRFENLRPAAVEFRVRSKEALKFPGPGSYAMHRLEILSAAKTNCEEAYARIACLGGRAADGSPWRLAAADAIRVLESGARSLFVRRDGLEHDVVIARDPDGHKLLAIAGDQEGMNALLFLPECMPAQVSPVLY